MKSVLETRPGYLLWTLGANRLAMQTANREAGLPCYCADLWKGYCDCCTGLASPERCQEQLKAQGGEQKEKSESPPPSEKTEGEEGYAHH